MDRKVDIQVLLKQLKTSGFILNCNMPMGYAQGFPVFKILNGALCMEIPYLRYKITGEVDKTLVFPIRYTVTVALPEGDVIGYENLEYNPACEKVAFSQPIGYFRHESIKQYNRKAYEAKKEELYTLYSRLANALIYGDAFTADDDAAFKELLQTLLEPSLLPIYRIMDRDFYRKYLEKGVQE